MAWKGSHSIGSECKNACALALNFAGAGFPVVILDVISEELAQAYASGLRDISYRCIRLLPSFDEIRRRNTLRGMRITEQEIAMLYEQQARLTACHYTIDNTRFAVNEVAGICRLDSHEKDSAGFGERRLLSIRPNERRLD